MSVRGIGRHSRGDRHRQPGRQRDRGRRRTADPPAAGAMCRHVDPCHSPKEPEPPLTAVLTAASTAERTCAAGAGGTRMTRGPAGCLVITMKRTWPYLAAWEMAAAT